MREGRITRRGTEERSDRPVPMGRYLMELKALAAFPEMLQRVAPGLRASFAEEP